MDTLKLLDKKSRVAIENFIAKMKQKSGVLGIIVLGGLGKNQHFDKFSDVDLVAIVDDNKDFSWLPEFEFNIPSDGPFEQIGINVHQVSFDSICSGKWDMAQKEAYFNGMIVHDSNGLIKEFIKKYTKMTKEDQYQFLMLAAAKIPPYIQINPAKQLDRGYPMAAANILNQGIDYLIDALYWINFTHIPSSKWKMAKISKLHWKPTDILDTLNKIYFHPDIIKRIELASSLAKPILNKIEEITKTSVLDLYYEACHILLNRQMNAKPFAKEVFDKLRLGGVKKEDAELLRNAININLYSQKTNKETLQALIESLNLSKEILDIIKN